MFILAQTYQSEEEDENEKERNKEKNLGEVVEAPNSPNLGATTDIGTAAIQRQTCY